MCAALLTEALSAARLVEPSGRLELHSTAFADGGPIPERFTMYDRNISPELHWKGVPGEALALALIVSDPDAIPVADKEWLHWAIVDIPPFVDRIPETAGAQTELPFNGRHLLNDFGDERYGGPKPPAGTGTHHYVFAMYALNTRSVPVRSGASLGEIRDALRGAVIDQAVIVGTFGWSGSASRT